MTDEDNAVPPRLRIAVLGTVALGAGVGVAIVLGWVNGPIGKTVLVAGALTPLGTYIVSEYLPQASRREIRVGRVVVALVLVGVLGTSWLWGRGDAAVAPVELDVPEQRVLEDVESPCGIPGLDLIKGAGSSRILHTAIARGSEERGDFIAVLLSDVTEEAPYGEGPRLVLLECDGTSWRRTAGDTHPVECALELAVTQLRRSEREEVLFSTICGSNGPLDYELLGVHGDSDDVETLQAEQGIHQGEVFQLRDRLVVDAEGGDRRELVWREQDNAFVEQDQASSAPAGQGLVVEFWWEPNGGRVGVSPIVVEPGERVYFRWDHDRHSEPEITRYRIQTSLPAEFRDDERGESYLVLNDPGISVEVRIIANESDWDRAIRVTVES